MAYRLYIPVAWIPAIHAGMSDFLALVEASFEAMVVLSENLHAIWRLPQGDARYPMHWGLLKAGFSRQAGKTEVIPASRQAKRERGLWQRRYWEHQIRNESDFEKHVDTIHYNPVKQDYVKRPIDWPFSTLHRYIQRSLLPANWANVIAEEAAWDER